MDRVIVGNDGEGEYTVELREWSDTVISKAPLKHSLVMDRDTAEIVMRGIALALGLKLDPVGLGLEASD